LLVFQHLVGMFHPLFAQVAYLFRDETFTEMKLLSARLNHESCSRAAEDVRECFSCCHCLRKRSRFNLAREPPISQKAAQACCARRAVSACSGGTYNERLLPSSR
jgi:hypothetical protein